MLTLLHTKTSIKFMLGSIDVFESWRGCVAVSPRCGVSCYQCTVSHLPQRRVVICERR
jgi:hypothetical protein